MKKLIFLSVFLFIAPSVKCQILFAESFNIILDTTKSIQGSITPDLKFQTQKENLMEFENRADISFRVGTDAITLANKFELTKYGNETILSGGYIFGEYRIFEDKVFIPEFYSQMHWTEARGLNFKFAGGVMGRFRLFLRKHIGIFAGTGPFYEYERWNHDGVPDARMPDDVADVFNENIKLGSYLSYKHVLFRIINLDLSLYHQSRFDEIFSTPRLASSSKIGFQLNEHLELVFLYQNIYDYKPVVPIDKLFHKYTLTLSVSF